MDNNNTLAFDINGIMQNANNLLSKLRTGEGLGLTPEQKEIFLKQMGEQNGKQAADELEKKLEQLRNIANNKPA